VHNRPRPCAHALEQLQCVVTADDEPSRIRAWYALRMSAPAASTLADNVRQLRAARALTQAQVAKSAGVPRATWAHLESGAGNPTLAVLTRVAAALQVSLEELVAPPERMELPPRARMTGTPHQAGTREYLTCEAGTLILAAGGQRWVLTAGEVVVFRGDQPHSYHNETMHTAVGYSAVVLGVATAE
jgi:transcriptional regulator with XRE-family HTH domain